MASDDQEKPYEPSQKRLDDARRKGQIPRSQDALTAAAYLGFLLAVVAAGPGAIRNSAQAGMAGLARPDPSDAGGLVLAMILPLLPLFLLPALPVLVFLILGRGLVFTGENLLPKLSRLDPIAAFRHRFGLDGLTEFLKSAAKMALVAAILAIVLRQHAEDLFLVAQLSPGPASAILFRIFLAFVTSIFAISLVFGGLDMLWQSYRHMVRNRMSRQEMMDEHREAEGDPHTEAARRQRAREIAMNRMLADVPTADVVIVNPQHYAVALKWNRARRQAPICVAKGVDEVAARIRRIAEENAVPIQSDPPTARALHASVEIGEQIRPEHFRPVAAAIRFAEAMRKRRRLRG